VQLAIALWSAAPLHSGYENRLKKQQLSECTILSLIARGIFAPLHPVDGWTIAFQANGPQGAWTTLWTGVDGPKRPPAHCPDHRDCPHPRAFAHAPHRAKGVTGSPYRVFMVTVTVNQEAGQRLRRGPRLRGSVSNGGLPTPLLHNTKSIHTRRARVGDKTILKQRLTLAAVRVE
jgi:hypothetical protein